MHPRRRMFLGAITAPLVGAWPASAAQAVARSGYFPNVPLRTQDGTRVRFYDDLLKGKVVAINFMFTTCPLFCPRATANLVKVQRQVGARLGRDVFMLSISLDPDNDSPPILKEYATAHDAKPGWIFLTGSKGDVDLIRRRLGVFDDGADMTEHTGILTYGNERTGAWDAMPVIAAPATIARALLRVAGPAPA
jgi:protein SCO1